MKLKFLVDTQMGPNGYSFVINNNGHLLHHPDFRPLVSTETDASAKSTFTIWQRVKRLQHMARETLIRLEARPASAHCHAAVPDCCWRADRFTCIFYLCCKIYDILKPNYNTVDLSEVELVDSDDGPRDSNSPFLAVKTPLSETIHSALSPTPNSFILLPVDRFPITLPCNKFCF